RMRSVCRWPDESRWTPCRAATRSETPQKHETAPELISGAVVASKGRSELHRHTDQRLAHATVQTGLVIVFDELGDLGLPALLIHPHQRRHMPREHHAQQIGRASCREKVR